MFTLNFKKEFAPAVEAGTKLQTIRAPRKDGKKPKAGDHLRLYTGLRTKGCRMLMDATCIGVDPIQIIDEFSGIAIVLAGERLTFEEGKALAHADGFNTRAEFVGFFLETHGLPFDGFRIIWRPKPSNARVNRRTAALSPSVRLDELLAGWIQRRKETKCLLDTPTR